MRNPYKVFHSLGESLREKINVVLVRPEESGNVGSVARALANMGIHGAFRIVGDSEIVDERSHRLAKHASQRLNEIVFYGNLKEAIKGSSLTLAATARIGSSSRPHPLLARDAIQRALVKLGNGEIENMNLVFGPESDGLRNEEVEWCDWVVTIPSSAEYRSLNLAHAVMVFAYEINLALTERWAVFQSVRPSQKEKLISHLLRLAEEVGFILPGDPFKMRPRLEEIFSHLPSHIREVKTLHGLIDQTLRSVRKGQIDMKGRYRKLLESRRRNE